MKLNNDDIELINLVQKENKYSIEEVLLLSREDILNLTDLLGGLIGYDNVTNDIDSFGRKADSTISKLLELLEQRNEM